MPANSLKSDQSGPPAAILPRCARQILHLAVNLRCRSSHMEGVLGMSHTHRYRVALSMRSLLLLMASPLMGTGQTPTTAETSSPNHAVAPSSSYPGGENNLESCFVHPVTSLPGSHQFASDFIEAIASDPDPAADDPDVFWGLTADLSNQVPAPERAMYISKSSDGGSTWTQIARVDSRYFDARIGEGLRNGFIVSPGGTYFVITTQRGAFQVIPQPGTSETLVRPIAGPRVPDSPPKTPITKKAGDPVRANVVELTADGNHLIIGYGYFDREPQLIRYHKDNDGSWIEDGPILHLPTEMDLLSLQFDDSRKAKSRLPLFRNRRSGLPPQPSLHEMEPGRWSRPGFGDTWHECGQWTPSGCVLGSLQSLRPRHRKESHQCKISPAQNYR